METCAICLAEVRETRQNKPIRCGHLFHDHCIKEWKTSGKNTCPVCRKFFDCSNFKVTINVENLFENTSNTLDVPNNHVFDVMDLIFDVETELDLESLLTDFGISVTDFDTSILNTE